MDPGIRSPLVDLFRRGEAARDVRLLAARGALAPREIDQVALLMVLTAACAMVACVDLTTPSDQGMSLSRVRLPLPGLVVGDTVRCPWHHWNWQLDNGALQSDPRQRTRTFEIAVDGEDVVLRA